MSVESNSFISNHEHESFDIRPSQGEILRTSIIAYSYCISSLEDILVSQLADGLYTVSVSVSKHAHKYKYHLMYE